MAEVHTKETKKESRPTSNERSPPDGGFECEFIDQPPNRSQCPICLLVPRDPQQTPCCGKAFCKACISKIREKNQPCPTCKAEDFHYFPDKGLQQELYSSKVYCTNKTRGCDWEGELRKLDLHLNTNPDKGKEMEGCKFQLVNCSHCQNAYLRRDVAEHQNKECGKRPFTCPTCEEYESTYDDVTSTHQSICKCRPVDCPNKCGQVMHHRKLKEHLSSECELSEVECEFSSAGCEAKMLGKYLPSHMTDNMAAHMSLLAKQNRKLTNRVTALKIKNNNLAATSKNLVAEINNLAAESKNLADRRSLVPVLHIEYPWSDYMDFSKLIPTVKSTDQWLSQPFYTSLYGPSLQLCIWNEVLNLFRFKFVNRSSDGPTLYLSTSIKSPELDKPTVSKKVWYGTKEKESESVKVSFYNHSKLATYSKYNGKLIFIIDQVEEIHTL